MEHQFKPHQPVVVRLNPNGKTRWYADFFSFYDKSLTLPYVCVGRSWAECLPAEGNEHLIGTTNDPTQPEPEFQFGDRVEVSDAFDSPIKWERAIFVNTETTTEKKAGKEFNTIKYTAVLTDGRYGIFYRNEIRHADW